MSNFIPEIYNQASKVDFFYNEFKRREANPEGFDSKLKNWIFSINSYCNKTNKFIFNIEDLKSSFELFNTKPKTNCLKLVLTNMLKDKLIFSLEDLKKQCNSNSNGWINWGFGTVKSTFNWWLSKPESSLYIEEINENISEKTVFVHLAVLDQESRDILTYVQENNLISLCLKYSTFEEKVIKDFNLDSKQIEIIVMILENRKKCKVINENLKIIKFDENPTINEKDISLFKLEDAKIMIQKDIDKLEPEIDKFKDLARNFVKENNKIKAKHMLRKKLRLESLILSKHNQLDNIELLEDQLLNSDSNKMVIDALAKSSEVLKTTIAPTNEIDDVLFNIEDALETQKSLVGDLSKSLLGNLDDHDLELELQEIIDENQMDKNIQNISKKPVVNNSPENDDLYERLRRLKDSPSNVAKNKVRIALSDDL